jgi:hypothetical protein
MATSTLSIDVTKNTSQLHGAEKCGLRAYIAACAGEGIPREPLINPINTMQMPILH